MMKIGISSSPAANMNINGDSYVIKQFDKKILLSVIDGLGHGEDAFKASKKAKNFIENHIFEDIKQIVLDLDEYLLDTRGVVIGIVKLDLLKKIISICGIGNVDIRIISDPPIYFLYQDGIVGSGRLRSDSYLYNIKVCERTYNYISIKLITLNSDGIVDKFDLSDYQLNYDHPQKIADNILKNFRKKKDDATIIVASFDNDNVNL